jgi:3-oxoacyl-[acyl-carrier-protein] synthase-1
VPKEQWAYIPLLLCVAERERPGRLDGLEEHLFDELCKELGAQFHPSSVLVPHGRIAAALALKGARQLLYEQGIERVLVAGADSYLAWPTLRAYQDKRRLLTPQNSNGFIPGEAGAAVLVSRPHAQGKQLRCWGLGFAVEQAPIESDEPLRADGLTAAFKAALDDAGVQMHDLDFRITDISGEHYYFKEASLALSRTLRRLKENFYLWHAADCVGETGAASGIIALAVAKAAGERNYAPGPGAMLHFNQDNGRRAAVVAAYH